MLLFVMVSASLSVLALAEREPLRFLFASASLSVLACALLIATGDRERALGLAAFLATAIWAVSKVKYYLSGRKLIVADVPLALAGTIPFMMVQYRRIMSTVFLVGLALIGAAVATSVWGGGETVPLAMRATAFGVSLLAGAVALRIGGGAAALSSGVETPHGELSTFAASLLEPGIWRRRGALKLSDMADEALPLLEARPPRTTRRPDLVFIQHESVFDPRLYGLEIGRDVADFLSPAAGYSGSLHVDIFGGGSWQSEFSIVTGLSSASFGTDAYFMLQRGVGRFRHTLPRYLGSLGYRTMLISSCRRGFLNYDAFYRSIGFDELLFSDDLLDVERLQDFERTHSDGIFLDIAMRSLSEAIDRHGKPHFAFVLTNFNHGPHDRVLASRAKFDAERQAAAAQVDDPQYTEYYARLAETACVWCRARSTFAERHTDRPALIVHYGDHQPVMTRRIERRRRIEPDANRQFRTFFAIEDLNGALEGGHAFEPPAVLDIALLGTSVMQLAGLPLDQVSATRASLVAECADGYFASASARKRGLHRTLIDKGFVRLDADFAAGR